MKWLELRNKRNGLFRLIQNIDRKRERQRERVRERERGGGGGGGGGGRDQAVALKAANLTCAFNNTELMKSAATGCCYVNKFIPIGLVLRAGWLGYKYVL